MPDFSISQGMLVYSLIQVKRLNRLLETKLQGENKGTFFLIFLNDYSWAVLGEKK